MQPENPERSALCRYCGKPVTFNPNCKRPIEPDGLHFHTCKGRNPRPSPKKRGPPEPAHGPQPDWGDRGPPF
jgi:predicted amidophosphoribosyltransferase